MSIMATSMLNQLALSNRLLLVAALPKTSILHFHFEDFVRRCCHSPSFAARHFLAESAATDERSNIWKLRLIKGAVQTTKRKRKGYGVTVSVVLVKETSSHRLSKIETTKFSFTLRDMHRNIVHEEAFISSSDDDDCSAANEVTKSFVMRGFKVDKSTLANGMLTVDVAIQVLNKPEHKECHYSRRTCDNSFRKNMLSLLNSGRRADLAFKVDGTIIRAHRLVLEANAPALARLCDDRSDPLNRPITITNTSPEAFRSVLQYIYGGDAPSPRDMLRMGKDLIVTSYRFGIYSLKTETEHALIENNIVNVSNCVDFIFFANKHDCILLMKHAMQYFSSRSKDMLNSEQSRKLKQQPDLMHKIITEMRSKEFRGSTQKRKARYQWLSRKGRGKKSKQKMSAWAQQENRSPLSNDVLLEIEGEDTISKLSAEEVRSEAKRILEAADDKQGSRSRRQRRRISES